jgi:hypothetical protein
LCGPTRKPTTAATSRQALALRRRAAAKLRTYNEARRIAAKIARLPEVLRAADRIQGSAFGADGGGFAAEVGDLDYRGKSGLLPLRVPGMFYSPGSRSV